MEINEPNIKITFHQEILCRHLYMQGTGYDIVKVGVLNHICKLIEHNHIYIVKEHSI